MPRITRQRYRRVCEYKSQVIARRMSAQAAAYAQQLYVALRSVDTTGAAQLLIELPPLGEDWLAVQDRLARATQAG